MWKVRCFFIKNVLYELKNVRLSVFLAVECLAEVVVEKKNRFTAILSGPIDR